MTRDVDSQDAVAPTASLVMRGMHAQHARLRVALEAADVSYRTNGPFGVGGQAEVVAGG